MPTPSAPDPHTPYTFSSTCPENDESSRSQPSAPPRRPSPPPPVAQHETPSVSTDDDEAGPHSIMPSHAGTDPADPSSPTPPIATHNPSEAMPFAEADDSSSPSSFSVDYHHHSNNDKSINDDDYVDESGFSPVGEVQTSRPRQGAGSSYATDDLMEMDNKDRSAQKTEPDSEYVVEEDYTLPSMGTAFPNKRMIPYSPSSFLRAGSKFTGTQQSERQVYQVQVEVKYVDLQESFLCGYLRIQGLTDDHPTLTTYFEGEIIGSKYTFLTKHADWGANDKTDLSHWAKFPAFRPYSKQARRSGGGLLSVLHTGTLGNNEDIAQNEHIFMRWKEHFLVPDHRVRTITGASFEGFYYICFNQMRGEVNGIYFHSKSERFQQLELKHVNDRGCFSSLEFR